MSYCFPQWLYHFTVPPTVHKGSNFSTSSPILIFVFVFVLIVAILMDVRLLSHSFDSCFPNDKWCWASFHVLIGHLYIFFGEMSIQIFCPFFNQIVWTFLLLSFRSSLCILDINSLLDIWFANNFSHSVGCLLTLLIVSFDAQNFKTFIKSSLFIFSFIAYAVGVIAKNSLPESMSRKFCLMFFF